MKAHVSINTIFCHIQYLHLTRMNYILKYLCKNITSAFRVQTEPALVWEFLFVLDADRLRIYGNHNNVYATGSSSGMRKCKKLYIALQSGTPLLLAINLVRVSAMVVF